MICVPCCASVTMRLETLMSAKTKHESGLQRRTSGRQRRVLCHSVDRVRNTHQAELVAQLQQEAHGNINACAWRRRDQRVERPIPSNRRKAHAPSQLVLFTGYAPTHPNTGPNSDSRFVRHVILLHEACVPLIINCTRRQASVLPPTTLTHSRVITPSPRPPRPGGNRGPQK
ncbi:hypothetical protein BJV78DRAFT_644814 [Lactifluus subvellereus]|nr:hypothetical protein BJV78DRAFT_644814 [Lactifluus subvellereus]